MDKWTEVALFRYQVIAPLLSLRGPRGTFRRGIEKIISQTHDHPTKGPIRIGYSTVEGWYYLFQKGGLDALKDRLRRDRGTSRVIDHDLAEIIETLALRYPDLDGPGILTELSGQKFYRVDELPSLSSLYRFFKSRGLDRRRKAPHKDHRAYAFDLAGDCWQCDVMYGPSLPTRRGTRRKTYLIGILDDATRLIPHAQFYFDQHLRCLKDCLRQAFLKRGLPRRLYVDNAKIFRSRLVLQIGARLGIQVIHTRPYQPQGRSKLERWFGTVRRTFLTHLDPDHIEGLEELNRQLWAFIEGDYHVRPHRGLKGQTPLDRHLALSEGIRPLPPEVDLDRLFLEQTTRRVGKDGTLTLHGKTFEAGPLWIGLRVTVLFDPFDLRRVIVESTDGQDQEAFPVDLTANRYVRRNPPPEPTPPPKDAPPLRAWQDLADRLEKEARPQEPHPHPHPEEKETDEQ